MKNRISKISEFLVKPFRWVPGTESLPKKITIRTSSEQTAFLESIQTSMHSGASFNDAISLLIDTMMVSQMPAGEVALGDARLLPLFKHHNIAEIHINRLLEFLKLPKQTAFALSDPFQFSSAFSNDDSDRIASFFGVQKSYLLGQAHIPYYVDNHSDISPIIKAMKTIQRHTELQPQFSLHIVSNMDKEGRGSLVYIKKNYVLDTLFSFSTYQCEGVFILKDKDIESLQSVAKELWFRIFELSVSGVDFDMLKAGGFYSGR